MKKKPTKSQKKKPGPPKVQLLAARDGTKSGSLIALLERPGGASIAEMMQATGWQGHSVRGFLAGTLKKQGRLVRSEVPQDKIRRYLLGRSS